MKKVLSEIEEGFCKIRLSMSLFVMCVRERLTLYSDVIL